MAKRKIDDLEKLRQAAITHVESNEIPKEAYFDGSIDALRIEAFMYGAIWERQQYEKLLDHEKCKTKHEKTTALKKLSTHKRSGRLCRRVML